MTHVSAPLRSAFILPAMDSLMSLKLKMPTTWNALDISRRHFEPKPLSWCRSLIVTMWPCHITEPRLRKFASMKRCCDLFHRNRQEAARFCRLDTRFPGISPNLQTLHLMQVQEG